MKSFLIFIPLLLLLLSPPSKSEMEIFPKWKNQICNGEEMACYTFEEAKKILKIDLDTQLQRDELIRIRAVMENLKKANEKLDDAYVLLAKDLRLTRERLSQKAAVLEDTTEKLSSCLEDDANNWIWWIVGSAAVTASFVGGVYFGLKAR